MQNDPANNHDQESKHRNPYQPLGNSSIKSSAATAVLAEGTTRSAVLDSARAKVYMRMIPLLFICYIIAYIDRNNVAIAKLRMVDDLPAFDNEVIGFGAGIFFWGYFLLEIPGTLLVERWSASKWICRIMVTWGILAACTAFVKTPMHFYIIRFLLGLAEAGFFPGVIVYLTHWFPARDRARAISFFLIASPIAMIIGPAVSSLILPIGSTSVVDGVEVVVPPLLGMHGWQWIYIFWGIPAVVMGIVVLIFLTDRPRHARWLTAEERDTLEAELEREKQLHGEQKHLSVLAGLCNPRVILLSLAYFGVVTGNYGIEFFLPTILKDWYELKPEEASLWVMIPSFFVIAGQIFNGWSSDATQERRWHAVTPILIGALGLLMAPFTHGSFFWTMFCFTLAAAGMKSYMPAFWSLPSLFLTSTAAAGSIGMINSFGNLGGFLGPYVLGKQTEGFDKGVYFLAATCTISACIIAFMPFKKKQ